MKSFLITTYFLLLACQAIGQPSQLVVADSSSRKFLPYASIWNGEKSLHANPMGQISNEYLVSDSIRIAHIGYQSRTLPTSQLRDTIFLSPRTHQLAEFVTSGILPTYELGYHNLKKGFPPSYHIFSRDSAMSGVYLEPPLENLMLEEVVIQFSKIKKGHYFELFMFHPDSSRFGGKLIAKKDVTVTKAKNKVIVDIRDLKVVVPEIGLYVAILYLERDPSGNKQEGFQLAVSDLVEDDYSFMVYQDEWFSYSKLRGQIADEFKNPFNFMIGVRAKPRRL